MERTFLEWKDEDCVLYFQNKETEEVVETISPKRGNASYAKKKSMKAWEIKKGLDGLTLDYPVRGMRSSLIRDSHLLLVTLTFDQKKTAKQEAWRLLTSKGKACNRFSAMISKVFGTKATWKIKEGTVSGYPAPHILVFVDKSVRIFRYKNGWRLQSQEKLERLRKAWPYGFIDVQAIVSNKVGKRNVVYYLTKYLTKTISPKAHKKVTLSSKEMKVERIAVQTHVWNKLFKSRDVLSKAFKQRLNQLRPLKAKPEPNEKPWSLLSIEYAINPLKLKFPDVTRVLPIKSGIG